MSDLEQRLADALAQGAEDAPASVGLAAAARERARRRRRARIGGGAAAVVVCVAVPTGVALVGGGSDDAAHSGPASVATDPAAASGVPSGLRAESWHTATILVPDSWGYGSLTDWCVADGTPTPRVQRPDTASDDILCDPGSTYGVSFQQIDNTEDFEWPVVQQPGRDLPSGAWEGARGIGGVLVNVIAPTQAQALDVLATMRTLGPEGDPNGCPVAVDSDPLAAHGMSICRYDGKGLLDQSERLTGDPAAAAEAALAAAPEGGVSVCPAGQSGDRIRMTSEAEDVSIDLGCGSMEVARGAPRQLTSDVLYWALSPGWSGSVPGGVSLPSELRQH